MALDLFSPDSFGDVASTRPCAPAAHVVDRISPIEPVIPIMPRMPGEDYILTPATSIHDEAGQYVVEVDLPGVDASNLDLSYGAHAIVVLGKRANPASLAGSMTGQSYRATIAVPPDADLGSAQAVFKNGALEITLRKSASASGSTKIDVK